MPPGFQDGSVLVNVSPTEFDFSLDDHGLNKTIIFKCPSVIHTIGVFSLYSNGFLKIYNISLSFPTLTVPGHTETISVDGVFRWRGSGNWANEILWRQNNSKVGYRLHEWQKWSARDQPYGYNIPLWNGESWIGFFFLYYNARLSSAHVGGCSPKGAPRLKNTRYYSFHHHLEKHI